VTGANACLESFPGAMMFGLIVSLRAEQVRQSKFNLRLNAEVFLFSAPAKEFMQSVRLPSRTWMCGG